MPLNVDEDTLKFFTSIRNKRAKVVIQHILEYGQITTGDLLRYGYKHAPRAIRDVREAGVPLETFYVKDEEGKSIAAYRFGDLSQIRYNRLAGRSTFPISLKRSLFTVHDQKCTICNSAYEARYLQVDHRIPYEISGDEANGVFPIENFMLLCASCNRAKSWSCEQCQNWNHEKDPAICITCYWASPEKYAHVAMFPERRMEVVWTRDEVTNYDWLTSSAKEQSQTPQEFLKYIIELARRGREIS